MKIVWTESLRSAFASQIILGPIQNRAKHLLEEIHKPNGREKFNRFINAAHDIADAWADVLNEGKAGNGNSSENTPN